MKLPDRCQSPITCFNTMQNISIDPIIHADLALVP
jgi:hypothetical protein